MAKYFFSSSFLLFLGNWIGQIALNWYVFNLYHNAIYLGLINFFRLVPILLISVWAGALADRCDRGKLLKITITSSFILTTILCILTFQSKQLPIIIFLLYALGRGIMSAIETPVRQAVLPDLTQRLTTTQTVSYHSFIINICRSIGPAVAGFIMAAYSAQMAFALQALCYLISILFCLPLKFKVNKQPKAETEMNIKIVVDYFKENNVGARIFITSLLIMATGFSYTTLLPVLTDKTFPDQVQIFGTAMTCCAIGGIIATIILPNILDKISMVKMYYMSSALFGISLLGTISSNTFLLFLSIFFIGLFSQWARTTNRIYFQHRVESEHRGKVLSVVMMDRGMIPLGAMLMSFSAELLGVIETFIAMGVSTIVIALLFGLLSRQRKDGGNVI
ncbi:MFS transporter [Staphylococcus succinus]|uniref:MFS transporter n=2 Tax=Staphylococcus succinus TaxID=61015 RepID=A0ABX5IP16_9STAP|nr:MFS transporter [Staphylococcus succinus]PTI70011.1 MFS transporter [Staphylococcus succinus]RIN23853.1 MFS transporter [Staphylococcus succinus]RIN39565.1 MFS transporter [Staphylococcus succinus]RIN44430.1 MFS transporter [Staphylococcus succinus]